jgi:hypothetical protein
MALGAGIIGGLVIVGLIYLGVCWVVDNVRLKNDNEDK